METLDEWITRIYKAERLSQRGADYEQAVRESHRRDYEECGYDVISHHESVTGETEYYPEKPACMKPSPRPWDRTERTA